MRIVHLCSTDTQGGASRGAYWLHRALCSRARLLDARGSQIQRRRRVISGKGPRAHGTRAAFAARPLPLARYHKTNESYWSVGWVPHRSSGSWALDPDIVHLHWIGAASCRSTRCAVGGRSSGPCATCGASPAAVTIRRLRTLPEWLRHVPQLRSPIRCDLSARVRLPRSAPGTTSISGWCRSAAGWRRRAGQRPVRPPSDGGHPERDRFGAFALWNSRWRAPLAFPRTGADPVRRRRSDRRSPKGVRPLSKR